MYNEDIKQQPVNFLDLERAYSDFANNFIMTSAKKNQPFFLYYPSQVSNNSTGWDLVYITNAISVIIIHELIWNIFEFKLSFQLKVYILNYI